MIASREALEVETVMPEPPVRSRVEPAAPPAAVEPRPAIAPDHDEVEESLYLIGRPKVKHFLRFVRYHAVDAPSEGELLEEWQSAKTHIAALETEEAGMADFPSMSKINVAKYEPLLTEFLKDPLVQNGFNTVPTEIAFVELDRMVVYQKHIDLSYVRRLQRRLGASLSDNDLFRACLPYDHPRPPVQWSRVDDDSYVFVSPSNDLRFLGPMSLKPKHVKGYPHPGELVAVIGLAVGFGSNFLNAIHCRNRLILNNGSHRAYALRDMGYTHVPCVVQHASTNDELQLVASTEVRSDPERFLDHPRPSMLKDYFNPRLRKVMPVKRELRQVKVRFSVSEHYAPAL